MSRHDKSLKRLFSKPVDFTWNELVSLMSALGYELKVTGGSHRKFKHRTTQATHFICEPHPSKVLKTYQVRDLTTFLKAQGIEHESDSETSRL